MYIDVNPIIPFSKRRPCEDDPRISSILTFPGRRDPYEEREPWIKPPKQPFVPIPIDDEYPVSKDEVAKELAAKTEAEKKSVMKDARRIVNRGLRTGRYSFPIAELCTSTSYVDFIVSQITNEYTAAGWKVKRNTSVSNGWGSLEFS